MNLNWDSWLVTNLSCQEIVEKYPWCDTFGFLQNIGVGSALASEIWGVLLGLRLAWDMRATLLLVESDNLNVVQLLQEQN